MPNIPGLDAVNFGGIIAKTMYWLGYTLLTLLIMGGLFAVFIFMQYKYKVTILMRGGTGSKNEAHAIGRVVKDRAREYRDKNGVTKWKLLFKRKNIQPPDYENIYPGKNLFLYQSGPNSYYPFKLTVSNPSASFEPIPHDVNLWTGLELREAAQEYQQPSFWQKYGNVAVMMGTIFFCLILVGVTVYYTYQHANGVSSALGGLTDTLKNVNTIGGVGPK